MAVWPPSLDTSPLEIGYKETPANVIIRSKNDEGPDKIRRWGIANSSFIDCQYRFTTAELAIFEEFFNDTLCGGALSFTFTHPRKATAISARIETPTFAAVPKFNGQWDVQFKLEILP